MILVDALGGKDLASSQFIDDRRGHFARAGAASKVARDVLLLVQHRRERALDAVDVTARSPIVARSRSNTPLLLHGFDAGSLNDTCIFYCFL